MKTFSRKVLSTAIVTVMTGMFVPIVFAQNVDTASSKETTDLDKVVVTGSRISNPNVVSPTPVSTLTAADIKATGAINIGDIMTKMPQLSTSFTMGNSGRFIGTAGVQLQDLRNLGTNRTLVLVNGRRFVGSSAGDTSVDVNLIPADWVERVEIITGGASAVYGADAVTGVVNFILKRDYVGGNIHAQYSLSEHGSFDQKFIAGTLGQNFAEDRGNFALSVEHSRQEPLEFRDRFGDAAYGTLNTPGGATDSVLLPDAGSFGIVEGGTFALRGKRYVFDSDGQVRLQRFSGPRDASRCQDCDHIDTNAVVRLQPKYSRSTISGVSSFELTPEHSLYWEGTYSNVHVKTAGQPAFGSGPRAYAITPDNAYATPELRALMAGSTIKVARFDVDAGRRGEDTDRNTARMVFGANGLISQNWEYDANINYGVTREKRRNLNNRYVERFFASIDAVRDPATGNIVCRSTIDPTAINPNWGEAISGFGSDGCVPTSIFGEDAINPGAANWFNTSTFTSSRVTQFVAGGTVTNNNLFEMPTGAGSASVAGGVEYRRETSGQINDERDIAGMTFLNAIPSFTGEYDVSEAYAEIALPILSDRPFFKSLTLDAAGRISNYSTIGNTQAWRWGLDWAFDPNVRMRGTMSAAVRAPNIGELFSGQSQNYFTINDPCEAVNIAKGADPAVRAANCLALGVPADYVDTNSASVEGLSGSNPNLNPETGRTYTFGFVLTPQFIEGFGFNADYWNINLTDAVSAPSGRDTANRCVDTPSGIGNLYCGNITRDPVTHEIIFVKSLNENISSLSTSGIDFGMYYSHDLAGGRMRWDVNATRVIAFTEHPFQDDPDETIEDNGTLGFPEWKATLRANYSLGDWSASWSARYFSEMLRVSNESYASRPNQTTPITAGSRTYNDLRVTYGSKDKGWKVYGGINNVLDRDPPVNLFGTGFGSALYDAIGRNYFVGMDIGF